MKSGATSFEEHEEMTDAELESMTVQDLRDLKQRVDEAIRSQIAKSRMAAPAARSMTVADQPPAVIDLERERDAWQARRR